MATKQQVLDLHAKHPDWSYQDIARELGSTPQYVYATFVRQCLPVPKRARENFGPKVRATADPERMRARAARLIAEAEVSAARLIAVAEEIEAQRIRDREGQE